MAVMNSWKVEDAKAHFIELVDAAVNGEPQILTSEGKEVAVLVSVETWKQLRPAERSIKDLLLSPEPRFDTFVPRRRRLRRRKPLRFQ